MKTAGIFEAKQSLSEYVERSQNELVVLTKHGKARAVIIGVEGLEIDAFLAEIESLILSADPKFWAMIKARRDSKAKPIPLAQVRKRLGLAKGPEQEGQGVRAVVGRRSKTRPKRRS